MLYLTNSFSINMLTRTSHTVTFTPSTEEKARILLSQGGFISAVGHAETAGLLENMLGLPVPANRVNITLQDGDVVVVAQYTGPRLPEGATSLPEGARIEFWLVEIAS